MTDRIRERAEAVAHQVGAEEWRDNVEPIEKALLACREEALEEAATEIQKNPHLVNAVNFYQIILALLEKGKR
jgi:hypothetical protein